MVPADSYSCSLMWFPPFAGTISGDIKQYPQLFASPKVPLSISIQSHSAQPSMADVSDLAPSPRGATVAESTALSDTVLYTVRNRPTLRSPESPFVQLIPSAPSTGYSYPCICTHQCPTPLPQPLVVTHSHVPPSPQRRRPANPRYPTLRSPSTYPRPGSRAQLNLV
ncbi:hypothetical protein C8Q80DRAFT_194827 [Daedaleopsis nitida]|nr:hypothetical protein C8Q80DRAFT_194827 [Daedaleopsis nitida]